MTNIHSRDKMVGDNLNYLTQRFTGLSSACSVSAVNVSKQYYYDPLYQYVLLL